MKISAYWITKNEEGSILRSINSLKDAVDEIVVVDTGSTDDTVRIARGAGARVEHFEWINDFAAARNHAIDLVSGDIVFLLDADEWFEPALTAKDRKQIESIFTSDPRVQVVQLVLNNLNDQGRIATQTAQFRVMRKLKGLRYTGSVHEFLLFNGEKPFAQASDKWQLTHSGYTEGLVAAKSLRNIELLEYSSEHEEDPEQRHKHQCYLVREYYLIDNTEAASGKLKLVLEEPAMLRRHLFLHGHTFVNVFYHMLYTAANKRDGVSRLEIRRKIVDLIRSGLKAYPGAATIDLYYEVLFDLKESRLLDKVGPALVAARKIPDSPSTTYRQIEARIVGQAAEAAFRRGKFATAMEYAVQTFKHTEFQNPMQLHILLNCLRGQQATDIAMLLNSQFDTKDQRTMKFLSTGTRIHGYRDIHAYYLDKCIKAEIATKGDYLYLLILYGKYEEAVKAAKEIHDEADDETVIQTIAMAAICSENEQLFEDNRGIMKKATGILDAYFSKIPLEIVTEYHDLAFRYLYPLIAVAAGIERADEFSEVFSNDRMLVYMVRMKYYLENGLYDAVLSAEMPDRNSYMCRLFAIQAMTMTGQVEEAFYMIKSLLDSGRVDTELLQYLEALSDRAQEPLKAEARLLYESYMSVYDKMIDLRDVVNTGYITEIKEKKKAKAYKAIAFDQFNKQLSEVAETPRLNGLYGICCNAAALFKEKSMPATAIDWLALALADCRLPSEEVKLYEDISGLLNKIGNKALASEILKRKGIGLKS